MNVGSLYFCRKEKVPFDFERYRTWLRNKFLSVLPKHRKKTAPGAKIHHADYYSFTLKRIIKNNNIYLDSLFPKWNNFSESEKWALYMYFEALKEWNVIKKIPYPLKPIPNWLNIPKGVGSKATESLSPYLWVHPNAQSEFTEFIKREIGGTAQNIALSQTLLAMFLESLPFSIDLRDITTNQHETALKQFTKKLKSPIHRRKLEQIVPLWASYIQGSDTDAIKLDDFRLFIAELIPGTVHSRIRKANYYRATLEKILERLPELSNQVDISKILSDASTLQSWTLWLYFKWLMSTKIIKQWPFPLHNVENYYEYLSRQPPHLLNVLKQFQDEATTSIIWNEDTIVWMNFATLELHKQIGDLDSEWRSELFQQASIVLMDMIQEASGVPSIGPETAAVTSITLSKKFVRGILEKRYFQMEHLPADFFAISNTPTIIEQLTIQSRQHRLQQILTQLDPIESEILEAIYIDEEPIEIVAKRHELTLAEMSNMLNFIKYILQRTL